MVHRFLVSSSLFVLLAAAIAASPLSAHAGNLVEGARATQVVTTVAIHQYVDVKADILYEPPTATSVPIYSGNIHVNVVVEGNICSSDPASFGVLRMADENRAVKIHLTVSSPAKSGIPGCLSYSSPTQVSFSIPFYVPEFSKDPIDENLGYIESFDPFTGAHGKKEFRLRGGQGKLTVEALDI